MGTITRSERHSEFVRRHANSLSYQPKKMGSVKWRTRTTRATVSRGRGEVSSPPELFFRYSRHIRNHFTSVGIAGRSILFD